MFFNIDGVKIEVLYSDELGCDVGYVRGWVNNEDSVEGAKRYLKKRVGVGLFV